MASDLISRENSIVALRRLAYQEIRGRVFVPRDAVERMLERQREAVDAVPVVRCGDCENFWEYTEEHKATVENADGDCAIRKWRSDDEQFCAVTKDDYCSLARRKKNA